MNFKCLSCVSYVTLRWKFLNKLHNNDWGYLRLVIDFGFVFFLFLLTFFITVCLNCSKKKLSKGI